jgi:SAM-dependent methyltransferase
MRTRSRAGAPDGLDAFDEPAHADYDGRMPTNAPLEDEPHRHRRVAESFGTDAERYDRTRPRYPDALVERIFVSSPGPRVLDVGIGTGIGARQFRAIGCEVLGVEPDERMAEFARRSGLEVEVATFEAWDPAGRYFDAIVAGQSWHWVDPIVGAAKAARVLRPGGRLAAFWNVQQPPSEVAEAFAEACWQAVPDSPLDLLTETESTLEGYQALFDRASGGIRESGIFGDPERWRFDRERSHTRDEWLDELPTSGALTRLPPEKLAKVLEDVGAAIDAMGGGFTVHYTTVAVTATLTDAP